MKEPKIVGVIPARYKSTRFPGKPLADICGKPMIWWVYQQFKLAKGISDVFVATDDQSIANVCDDYHMKYILTSDKHPTHLDRLAEVAEKIEADFYININGDEPLMKPEYIECLLPNEAIDPDGFYFANAMTKIGQLPHQNWMKKPSFQKLFVSIPLCNNKLAWEIIVGQDIHHQDEKPSFLMVLTGIGDYAYKRQ